MHLSWSQIRMLMRCPKQWEFRYVRGVIRPPGVALVIGAGTHRGVEVNMRNKIDEGKPMPLDAVLDVTRDSVIEKIGKDGIRGDGAKRVLLGEAIDGAVTLSELHYKEVAPQIEPVAVERDWQLNIEGEEKSIKGVIDIEVAGGIRDTKTTGKTPPKNSADKDDQLTMYALAYRVLTGKMPEILALDYLVRSNTPKPVFLSTNRTEVALEAFLLRLETAFKLIESGIYMPCDRSNWCCDPKWCGYYDECPYTKE